MVHPLNGGNGQHFLVEINGGYIQQLYKERDEALARNRELESDRAEWFQAAQEQINALAEKNTELRSLARDWQKLVQEYDDLSPSSPDALYEAWGKQWKELVEQTNTLAGMEHS